MSKRKLGLQSPDQHLKQLGSWGITVTTEAETEARQNKVQHMANKLIEYDMVRKIQKDQLYHQQSKFRTKFHRKRHTVDH